MHHFLADIVVGAMMGALTGLPFQGFGRVAVRGSKDANVHLVSLSALQSLKFPLL